MFILLLLIVIFLKFKLLFSSHMFYPLFDVLEGAEKEEKGGRQNTSCPELRVRENGCGGSWGTLSHRL